MSKTFQPGEYYRAKSGEIMKVLPFTNTECRFLMLDPVTLAETTYQLDGPLEGLADFAEGLALEKIDIETHKPTGLITKGNEDEENLEA